MSKIPDYASEGTIVARLIRPLPTTDDPTLWCEAREGSCSAALVRYADGRFELQLIRDNAVTWRFSFCQVRFSANGPLGLGCGWSADEEPVLYVNQTLIPKFKTGEIIEISNPEREERAPRLREKKIDISIANNEIEHFFLNSLNELGALIWAPNNDNYSLIRSTSIMRLLLLDERRLVDLVNREYRLKIVFPTRRARGDQGMLSLSTSIYPRYVDEAIDMLNIDRFLKHAVGSFNGKEISVGDFIDTTANEMGGVHYRQSTDGTRNRSATSGLYRTINGPNGPIAFDTARAIGRCIIDALIPLVESIHEKNLKRKPNG